MDSEDEHKSVKGDSSGGMKRTVVPCGCNDRFDLAEKRVSYAEKTDDDRQEDRFAILMQQAVIRQVSNTLSIPRVSATILLRHHNWDVDKAQDAWFADEEKVRKDVGLSKKQEDMEFPIQDTENTTTKCMICFDKFPRDFMYAATTCGHLYCNLCWTQYAKYIIKISDGSGILKLRCPIPSCVAGEDMVNEYVSDEDRKKYSSYLYSSPNDGDKKRTKQCPSPGCEFAVELIPGSSSYDVTCSFGHRFCWNCVEDAHRPVDCDTVHKWGVKNSAESENVIWILVNSKSCPKCKRPIQKEDEGCLHMNCSCGFNFCWLCLGDWLNHCGNTGGNSACNMYEKEKARGRYDEEENIQRKAKDYLDRYAFCYRRFAEHQNSRQEAVERLQKMQSDILKEVSDTYGLTDSELEFITDAWMQIIECRRVLKWTYAYGYYLPKSEKVKTDLFGYMQDKAESELETLYRCTLVELRSCLKKYNDEPEEFNSCRRKLVDLTSVTRMSFENLVRALENGLSTQMQSHDNAQEMLQFGADV